METNLGLSSTRESHDMNNVSSFCSLNCFCDPGTTTTRSGSYPHHQNEGPLPRVSDRSSEEDVFAAALRSLTFQEREAISDEIHGVGNSVVEETLDRVLEALKSLRENYLSNRQQSVTTDATTTNNFPNASRQDQHTLSAKREAYDRAVFLRPMLEKDDKLHLMFLRAQRFNPRLAALNMFVYFEHKRALFGDELLTQKITLKDLTDHEVRLIREGVSQLLAGREITGRGIIHYRIGQWDLSSPLALVRTFWYIHSAIEDDEEMQRNGVVMLCDWQGPFRHSPYDNMVFLSKIQPFSQSCTYRAESVHSVYGNGSFLALIQSLFAAASKHLRVRHRFHFGSQLETTYSLRTFGIDMGEVPNSSKSTWSILPGSKVTTIDEYIQRRSLAEEQWREKEKVFQEPSAMIALVPNPHDILMGRSKFASRWPGNMLYHTMIAQYAQRYIDPDSKSRIDKTLLTMEVIHALQNDYGSRFLSRKDTRWVVAADEAIQKKVNQSLRLEARSSQARHAPRRFS
jgi:hypothetical protein